MIRDAFLWLIGGWLAEKVAPVVIERKEPVVAPYRIRESAEALQAREEDRRRQWLQDTFRPAEPPRGVLPPDVDPRKLPAILAHDDASTLQGEFLAFAIQSNFAEGVRWLGYPYLSELMQRAEYRIFIETIAEEMTRKWIEFEAADDDDDKTDKIKKMEDACAEYELRQRFYQAKVLDGAFGVGHLYIDLDGKGKFPVRDDPETLRSPLIIDKRTIAKGALRRFTLIEPLWTYPADYNADDPLNPNFYKPIAWYVMGKTVHRTRLLTFIGSPVPDLLKASYSFGGLSLTQRLKPYVDYWLRTRSDVSDLINNFSTMILKTDMSAVLNNGGNEYLLARAMIFNSFRNNNGLMYINKGAGADPGEEMSNIAVPLSSLPELQAQSQEHMASVGRTPLVKAFGITPSGLNASSDGEIRTFYDTIHAMQERDFSANLKIALDVIQLSKFGEIDPSITHKFVQLWQLDEAGEMAVEKTKADIRLQDIEAGIIDPSEARASVARDKKSPYAGLDLGDEAPGLPDVDPEGKPINEPLEREINAGGIRGSTSGANSGV